MKEVKFHAITFVILGTAILSSCFTDYADDEDLKIVVNKTIALDPNNNYNIEDLRNRDAELRQYYEDVKYPSIIEPSWLPTVYRYDHELVLPDGSKMLFVDMGLKSGTLWGMVNLGSDALKDKYTKTIDDFLEEPIVFPELPELPSSGSASYTITTISVDEYLNNDFLKGYLESKEGLEKLYSDYWDKTNDIMQKLSTANMLMKADYENWLKNSMFGTTNGTVYAWDGTDPVTAMLGEGYSTPTLEQFTELKESCSWGCQSYSTPYFDYILRFNNRKEQTDGRALLFPFYNNTGSSKETGYYMMTKDILVEKDETGKPMMNAVKVYWTNITVEKVPVTGSPQFYIRAVYNKK